MPRPTVDVVVPFRGAPAELGAVRERMAGIGLGPGDSLEVAHNEGLPGRARNRGAARGSADWIVFVDADAVPEPGLLDRYFDPPPGERTAVVAGGVADEHVPPGAGAVARYAHLRGASGQHRTLGDEHWGYPMTTNAAFRREAFEAAGGFREDIRAAEDADLAYRLRAAGWESETREAARVVHRGRARLRSFVAQRLVHGAGGGWLEREYPGSSPARRLPGLTWWGVRTAAGGLVAAARERDRDRLVWALLEPVDVIAWELGRSLPNERPLPRRWRMLERA